MFLCGPQEEIQATLNQQPMQLAFRSRDVQLGEKTNQANNKQSDVNSLNRIELFRNWRDSLILFDYLDDFLCSF